MPTEVPYKSVGFQADTESSWSLGTPNNPNIVNIQTIQHFQDGATTNGHH